MAEQEPLRAAEAVPLALAEQVGIPGKVGASVHREAEELPAFEEAAVMPDQLVRVGLGVAYLAPR